MFDDDAENFLALTGVLSIKEDKPQNNKRKRKHRLKKEKPQPMDPLIMSPMFLDDDTNVLMVAYKDAILYSLYKDDIFFCCISSILVTKWYKPPILREDRCSYYWKMTYTYGLWPPGPKNTTLKEPTITRTSPRVSFAPKALIYSI